MVERRREMLKKARKFVDRKTLYKAKKSQSFLNKFSNF